MKRRSAMVRMAGAGIGAISLKKLPGIRSEDFQDFNRKQTLQEKPFFIPEMPDYVESGTQFLKIGLCQIYTEPWNIKENLNRTLKAIDEAALKGAEIAVTPECVIHGYPWDESLGKSASFRKRLYGIAENPEGENLSAVRERAKKHGMYVMIGFVEKGDEDIIHNTAALISPAGNYVFLYRKVHCRHFESIDHWGYFTPGDRFYSEELNFGDRSFQVGAMICFDREIPESMRCLRALGSEIILCPLATDTSDLLHFSNRADNEMITRIGSTSNEQFIVVVNHSGRFNGGSFVTGPMGEVFCQLSEEPAVEVCDVPVGAIRKKFHNEPLGWMGWGYRRPDIYNKYL